MQRSRVTTLVLLLLTALPQRRGRRRPAQKEAFFDTLLPLYRSLAGTYGDEGTRLAQPRRDHGRGAR